jgi:hypothetical protein
MTKNSNMYFTCIVCNADMFELQPGEVCYLVSKQIASEQVSEITKQPMTVFKRNVIGFRFCEECWTSYAGKDYEIKSI